MSEFYLDHVALLYLLDSVEATALVSLAPAHLFPADADERKHTLKQGEHYLARTGLLQFGWGGTPKLDARLASIATTIAFPKIAVLILANDRQHGLQLFWFYQTQEHIVEHTFTAKKLHRLTELPDVAALIARLETILAIQDTSPAIPISLRREIDQNAFFTVKNHAKQHNLAEATAILHDYGFTDQDAASFLQVLTHPFAAGNVAFLRCEHETVIDGRNIALLQDEEHGLWSARQNVPGIPTLVVETTDAATLDKQLHSYFKELSLV
ncbi:MAG TPA: hypothetical protein VEV19_01255 [Ktedonobacteraceae bacterium]|nr:hypothetical protein [Ktedonobacteraceae bacterium]